MIKAEIYQNKGIINGFKIFGHAGHGKYGEDIVCSAVSVLVLNTINCIEDMTDSNFSCEADENDGGYIYFSFKDEHIDNDAIVLINAMARGLCDISNNYSDFIEISFEEVQ